MEMYYVSFKFNGFIKVQSIQGVKTEIQVDSLAYKLIINSAIGYWLKENKMIGVQTEITNIVICDSEQTILLEQDNWSDFNTIH